MAVAMVECKGAGNTGSDDCDGVGDGIWVTNTGAIAVAVVTSRRVKDAAVGKCVRERKL